MKKPVILSLTAVLFLSACTGSSQESQPAPPNPGPTSSSTPTPTESSQYPEGVTPMDPAEINPYLPDPSAVDMQAVIADEDTVYVQLTGSSSCPAIPETITSQNGALIILTHEWKGNCTADLGTSGWEISLPAELVPRTEDLEVLVYTGSVEPSVIIAEPISEENISQSV